MAPTQSTLASGVRSVAVSGDVTNSVIVTGDDVTIELRVDTDDALLAKLLENSRAPRRTPRPLPLDGVPPPSLEHVDRRDEAQAVRAAIAAGRTFHLSGPREIGKTFVVRHALAGRADMEDGSVYVFARGKRYADVLQELHEAFFRCEPPAVVGEQQIRRDLAAARAIVVLDTVELERDELRQLAAILPGCHLLLVARERALGEGGRLALRGLATDDALALVEQELGRRIERAERGAAAEVCARLGGHPYELRQAAADVRDGERSFAELAATLARDPGGAAPPGSAGGEGGGAGVPGSSGGEPAGEDAAGAASARLAELLRGSLSAQDAAVVELLAALRGASIGAEHIAALSGVDDLMPALRALEARRLIASASPRFQIAGALHERAAPDYGAVARATAYFATWARRQRARPGRVLTEAQALVELVHRAEAEGRDADLIALGRASDAAFAHGRRWGTWGAVLEAVLGAAERSGDDGSRAWALHQLGTRAYCLGEAAAAVVTLQEALRLRERIGDDAGARATRYNLDFIAGPPLAGDDGGGGSGGGAGPATRRSLGLFVALAAVLAALGAAVAIGLRGGGDDPKPPATTDGLPVITNPAVPPPPIVRTVPGQTRTTPPPPPPPPPPPVVPPVNAPPIIPPPVNAPPVAPPIVAPPPPPPPIG